MNRNTALTLIIFGIIALLLGVFAVRPLFLSIKQGSEEIVSQKKLLAEFETKSENLKDFRDSYDFYQMKLAKMEDLFVDKEEPIGFIEFLEKEAAKAKLSIDITPLTPKETDEAVWPSVNFRLSLEGSFAGFLKLLNKIESSPYLVNLSDFNFRKTAQDSNGDVSTSFLIEAYAKQ